MKINGIEQNIEPTEAGLLTRKELAAIFKVCVHTIQNWERQGKLTPIRVNKRVLRYHPSCVGGIAR